MSRFPDAEAGGRPRLAYRFWPAVAFVLAVIVVEVVYGVRELVADWPRLVHEWTGVEID
jgi:hypothetical protein